MTIPFKEETWAGKFGGGIRYLEKNIIETNATWKSNGKITIINGPLAISESDKNPKFGEEIIISIWNKNGSQIKNNASQTPFEAVEIYIPRKLAKQLFQKMVDML